MEYEIDSPDEIIDSWLPMFEAISIDQFEKFSDLLRFPTNISPELREISKEFSLSILNYLGRTIPEQPSRQLYAESIQLDPMIQIWMNIFSQLKSLGYANDVYLWGQSISNPTEYPLNAKSFVTEWDILLIDWTHAPSNSEFSTLNLPHSTTGKLQLIIKQYEINQQKLRFQLKQSEENPNDIWEEYAFKTLRIGSWISNNAQYQIQLSKWKAIFSTLSKHELDTLDKWGYENFIIHNAKNYSSLLQFANNLHESSPK